MVAVKYFQKPFLLGLERAAPFLTYFNSLLNNGQCEHIFK